MRIICIPVYFILMFLRLITEIVLRLSAWIFYLLGALFLLVTIMCYCMQIETSEGLRRMLIGCGVFILIPQAAEFLSAFLEVAAERIVCRVKGI